MDAELVGVTDNVVVVVLEELGELGDCLGHEGRRWSFCADHMCARSWVAVERTRVLLVARVPEARCSSLALNSLSGFVIDVGQQSGDDAAERGDKVGLVNERARASKQIHLVSSSVRSDARHTRGVPEDSLVVRGRELDRTHDVHHSSACTLPAAGERESLLHPDRSSTT